MELNLRRCADSFQRLLLFHLLPNLGFLSLHWPSLLIMMLWQISNFFNASSHYIYSSNEILFLKWFIRCSWTTQISSRPLTYKEEIWLNSSTKKYRFRPAMWNIMYTNFLMIFTIFVSIFMLQFFICTYICLYYMFPVPFFS